MLKGRRMFRGEGTASAEALGRELLACSGESKRPGGPSARSPWESRRRRDGKGSARRAFTHVQVQGAGEAGTPGDVWRMGCTGTRRKAWRAVG